MKNLVSVNISNKNKNISRQNSNPEDINTFNTNLYPGLQIVTHYISYPQNHNNIVNILQFGENHGRSFTEGKKTQIT